MGHHLVSHGAIALCPAKTEDTVEVRARTRTRHGDIEIRRAKV